MLTVTPPADVAAGGLDGLLSALSGTGVELAGVGAFVWLVVLLLRRESSSDARHTAELTRISELHDAELAELREENARLRTQRDHAEAAARACWLTHPGATSPSPPSPP